jgi:hypothetical protein
LREENDEETRKADKPFSRLWNGRAGRLVRARIDLAPDEHRPPGAMTMFAASDAQWRNLLKSEKKEKDLYSL